MKYNIAIEETYLMEFEIEAESEDDAESIATSMWERNDEHLPCRLFTGSTISVDGSDFNELSTYQPWLYTPMYVVEWGNDNDGFDVGAAEYSELSNALSAYMNMELEREGDWKYLQVDYVDNGGEYHPEMNHGLLHEQYEEV